MTIISVFGIIYLISYMKVVTVLDSLYNAEDTIEKRIEAYAKEIIDNADNAEALDRLYKYVSIYTSINALKMNEAARGLVAQMTDAVHNIDVEDLKKAGLKFNA